MAEKVNPVDCMGKTLNVGDEVVFVAVGGKSLRSGKITKLNPKTAAIEYVETYKYYDGRVVKNTFNKARAYDLIVRPLTEKSGDRYQLTHPSGFSAEVTLNGNIPTQPTTKRDWDGANPISKHTPAWELRTSDDRK